MMMPVRPLLVALIVLAVSGAPTRVLAGCKLVRFAHLPVTMTGLRPMVSAKINGVDAPFIADSGAFLQHDHAGGRDSIQMETGAGSHLVRVEGVGGEAAPG